MCRYTVGHRLLGSLPSPRASSGSKISISEWVRELARDEDLDLGAVHPLGLLPVGWRNDLPARPRRGISPY
ncbi:hypothetical protein RRG08_032381 [Elysia crispata]|uniref:Uncharacterized protein n=1 Tax=Elysia crispata TaxID=231223 RepID=A0AAE1DYX3_9GAST|nr:hypothetical protein RRG08_032381 [Elysia crispata]